MPHDHDEVIRRARAVLAGLDPDAPAPELQGDCYQERLHREVAAVNGVHKTQAPAEPKPPPFPEPIPASQLKKSAGQPWLWHGYLAPGAVTLMSALWKAGKTTLLAHLLRGFETGGEFCGRELSPARVLYVTEESEHRWACRRDAIGLADHLSFLVRPFGGRPDWSAWSDFTLYLRELVELHPVDLVVLDPLVNLWPVRDENDNAQVLSALLPLQAVANGPALLLVHHHRKGDGQEGTASRGAGALTGFVDTIIEMRRYNAGDRQDRKRVLTAYGRDDETPEEVVIELTEQGYVDCGGSRAEMGLLDLLPALLAILPEDPPGWACGEVAGAWPPERPKVGVDRLIKALHKGADLGRWERSGTGKRGSPYRFYRPSE